MIGRDLHSSIIHGSNKVTTYAPERLNVSLKVNSTGNMSYNDSSSLYYLHQVSLQYKKRPLEHTRSNAEYNEKSNLAPISRQKAFEVNESGCTGNRKKQFHENTDKRFSSENLGIFYQQPYGTKDQLNSKKSRITNLSSKNYNFSPRKTERVQPRFLESNPSFLVEDSLDNSQNIGRLLKEHSTLLHVIRQCRDYLAQSMDESSRRKYERRFLIAMEKAAVIKKTLKDLGCEMPMINKNGLDHTISKSSAQFIDIEDYSPKTDPYHNKSNDSASARFHKNKPNHPASQSFHITKAASEISSFRPSKEIVKQKISSYAHSTELSMTQEKPLMLSNAKNRRMGADTSYLTKSEIPTFLMEREPRLSQNTKVGEINSVGINELNFNGYDSVYSESKRRNDTKPSSRHVHLSEKSSTKINKQNKQEILAIAVNLRKKYLHYKKKIKSCREKLGETISTQVQRERIENDYFNAQIQAESIKGQLKKLAEQLNCNAMKFFKILNIHQDDDEASLSKSRCYQHDDNINQFLRNNLSFLSDTSDSDETVVHRKQFESGYDHDMNGNRVLIDENSTEQSYEIDEYNRKGRFSLAESLELTMSSSTENKMSLKSTGIQTDCYNFFEQEEDEFLLSDKRSSAECENTMLEDHNKKFQDQRKSEPVEYKDVPDFLSPNESENLEKLRKKRLAFFRKDHLNPSEEIFVEVAAETTELDFMPFDDKQEFRADIGRPEIVTNDSQLLLPLVPRMAKVDSSSENGSEFSRNPVIYDVTDVQSEKSEDDILYKNQLKERLLQPCKTYINRDDHDFNDDLNDDEERNTNLKLYDVDDFESKDCENDEEKVQKFIMSQKHEAHPINIESTPTTFQRYFNDINNNNEEMKINSSSNETSPRCVSNDDSIAASNVDDNHNEVESYKSILDIDYEKLFSDSELISPSSKVKLISSELDGNHHTIFDTDCGDHEMMKVIDRDVDERVCPGEEDDMQKESRELSDKSKSEKTFDRLITEPEIQVSEVIEEESSFISQEMFCDYEDEISQKESICLDENPAVSSNILMDVDDEPRLKIPNLKDSIPNESDLIKDEESVKYLDFVLEDDEERMAEFAEDYSNEDDKEQQRIIYFEEETIDLDAMSPRVETMPTETSLAVSLKQSLKLLDELEAYEQVENMEEKLINDGTNDTNDRANKIKQDEEDDELIDDYEKPEDLLSNSTVNELQQEGYDLFDLEDLITKSNEINILKDFEAQKEVSNVCKIPENIPKLDLSFIDGIATNESTENFVDDDVESDVDVVEFEKTDSESNILTDDVTEEEKIDSDTETSDNSTCSILRSPLKNFTDSQENEVGDYVKKGVEKVESTDLKQEAFNKEPVHTENGFEKDNFEDLSDEDPKINVIESEEESIGEKGNFGDVDIAIESSNYEKSSEFDNENVSHQNVLTDISNSDVKTDDIEPPSSYYSKEEENVKVTNLEVFKEDNSAENKPREEISEQFSETFCDEVMIDFECCPQTELEVGDSFEMDENEDWINSPTLDEKLNEYKSTGIVNTAVIEKLELEKIDKQDDIQPRPASDLREEYHARLDLLSLPSDLCNNLPLKLPSLISSSDSEDLFLKFQEGNENNDNHDVSSERTLSRSSSSDSEPEIQFGPGYKVDSQAKVDLIDVSKINKENSTDSLEDVYPEEIMVGDTGYNIGNSSENAFENLWFEDVNLEHKHERKSIYAVKTGEMSTKRNEQSKGLQEAEQEAIDDRQIIHHQENTTEDEQIKCEQLESEQNDCGQLEEMFGIESFSEISSCDTSFRDINEIDEKLKPGREEDLIDMKSYFDDNDDKADGLCNDKSVVNKIDALENAYVGDEEEKGAESLEENSMKYEKHDRLIEALNDIEITTQETGYLLEDVELEEFEEFELMFEKEAEESEENIECSSGKKEDEDEIELDNEVNEKEGDVREDKENEERLETIRNEMGKRKEIEENQEAGSLKDENDNKKENTEKENEYHSDLNEEDMENIQAEDEFKQRKENKECHDLQIDDTCGDDSAHVEKIYELHENHPDIIIARKGIMEQQSSNNFEQKMSACQSETLSQDTEASELEIEKHESLNSNVQDTNAMTSNVYEDEKTRSKIQPTSPSLNKIPNFATPVVIDNGSGYTKAGLSSREAPSVVIPAIIGKPHYEQIMHDPNTKEFYVGEEAERYRGVLKLSYPLEHGIVTDWNDLEKLWDHVLLHQLRIDPSEHPVLLTEAALNPKKNRERMLEIMMETYQVPAFYIAIQAVLSLYVTGKTTGIVLDSGDGVTHIVPVYDGYSLPHATERMDIAGRDLTEYLMRIFMERGYSFTTSAEKEICKDIKEKLCFVADDFDESIAAFQTNSDKTKTYMLPDGQIINVGDEQFRCPEILFQPNLIGKDIVGVHEYLYKSIQKCDVDLRSELYSNIVLSGGTTLLDGIDNRLKIELGRLSSTKMNEMTKIRSLTSRRYSVWCGAAALASLSTFSHMWITADDYYDCGVDIVHRKCF